MTIPCIQVTLLQQLCWYVKPSFFGWYSYDVAWDHSDFTSLESSDIVVTFNVHLNINIMHT